MLAASQNSETELEVRFGDVVLVIENDRKISLRYNKDMDSFDESKS